MGVSVDGFISDRDGNFNWSVPSDDLFAFHTERVGELGAFVCGRRLYETMLVWETDPRMRENDADAAFADLWSALPKVVFSRTLTSVEGNARLAQGSLADELTGRWRYPVAAAGRRHDPAVARRDPDLRRTGDLRAVPPGSRRRLARSPPERHRSADSFSVRLTLQPHRSPRHPVEQSFPRRQPGEIHS